MCVFGCLKRVMVRLSSICKPPISSFWTRKCNEVLRDECHQRLQNFTVLSSSIFEWPSSSGSASYGSFYDFIRFLASPPISNQMNTFEIFIQTRLRHSTPWNLSKYFSSSKAANQREALNTFASLSARDSQSGGTSQNFIMATRWRQPITKELPNPHLALHLEMTPKIVRLAHSNI